jgi:hypothetical protein
LIRGASQINLAVRDGVSLNFGPVDVTEYTKAEIKAAVADAESWGTTGPCTAIHTRNILWLDPETLLTDFELQVGSSMKVLFRRVFAALCSHQP